MMVVNTVVRKVKGGIEFTFKFSVGDGSLAVLEPEELKDLIQKVRKLL